MERHLTLMNKDYPVLQVLYDYDLHVMLRITEVYDLDHAPPGILDHKGIPNRRTLNDWWRDRAIPASREHLRQDFPYLDDTVHLAEKGMGLSLSDRYWVTEDPSAQRWADVNFFDNPFTEDLGLITLGSSQQSYDMHEDMFSPNGTLNGDLQKKWTVQDGERILLKSGSGPFNQEPYNEAIASILHERLLRPADFVPYRLDGRYSVCPNMLGQDEELVPMWDLFKNHKKPNDMNDYRFCLHLCEGAGIPEEAAALQFEKMFSCDFILANSDRHYRNFGLIRNVETLEYTGIAPIYDTGRCLWCKVPVLQAPADYEYRAKPFNPDGMDPKAQLGLFHDFRWFDGSALDGFAEDAGTVLKQDPLLTDMRIGRILKGLDANIEYIRDYAGRERLRTEVGLNADRRAKEKVPGAREEPVRKDVKAAAGMPASDRLLAESESISGMGHGAGMSSMGL